MDKLPLVYRILTASALSVLLLAASGVAQPRTATPAPTPAPAASTAPAPNERDVAATQTELIRLLRLSPTLTTVVSHDPSLLSNTDYVAHNNPQLAAFLTAHPEVARNPEFYLFSHLKHEDGQPDEALERAVWPDVYRSQGPSSPLEHMWGDIVPLIAFGFGLTAIFVLARMFVENRRWSRIFKLQSDVHGKLIDKFTSNQELAAYMETEAGRKFLEAAPIPVGIEQDRRVPSAVARVLTPLQAGIVMVLLGIGLLLAAPCRAGYGYADALLWDRRVDAGNRLYHLSRRFVAAGGEAGIDARRNSSAKPVRFVSRRFLRFQGQAVSRGETGEGEEAEADALGVHHSERAGRRGTVPCRRHDRRGNG